MGSNTFGVIFKITTWGESHGKAIGVVIDGCPAGLHLCEEEIEQELAIRRPGQNAYTSPRQEMDQPHILSGVFQGKTTGTPISIVIYNQDMESAEYEPIKELLRPGHAHFTYLQKYGIFDYRGGGRASARETACRVAAGCVAKKLLTYYGIDVVAYLKEIGGMPIHPDPPFDVYHVRKARSGIFCANPDLEPIALHMIEETKKQGNSIGGVVEVISSALPIGLGDPIYEKLEANLAKAMLSLPATKGFEIGSGFEGARMQGSQHNDPFQVGETGKITTTSNHAGGTLGGISSGASLIFRVGFKPTSSVRLRQETVDIHGKKAILEFPKESRHDPCVAIRATPVVEAMTALVLADALLLNRCSRL